MSSILTFHTAFKEYRGRTSRDIIEAIYEDAKPHLHVSFDDWWDYQKRFWKVRKDFDMPQWSQPDASAIFLKFLIESETLSVGPRPESLVKQMPRPT